MSTTLAALRAFIVNPRSASEHMASSVGPNTANRPTSAYSANAMHIQGGRRINGLGLSRPTMPTRWSPNSYRRQMLSMMDGTCWNSARRMGPHSWLADFMGRNLNRRRLP
jgi:hypothetical protein